MNRRSFFGKLIGAVACLFGVRAVASSDDAKDVRRAWFRRSVCKGAVLQHGKSIRLMYDGIPLTVYQVDRNVTVDQDGYSVISWRLQGLADGIREFGPPVPPGFQRVAVQTDILVGSGCFQKGAELIRMECVDKAIRIPPVN